MGERATRVSGEETRECSILTKDLRESFDLSIVQIGCLKRTGDAENETTHGCIFSVLSVCIFADFLLLVWGPRGVRPTPMRGGMYVNLFAHYRPIGDPKWFSKQKSRVFLAILRFGAQLSSGGERLGVDEDSRGFGMEKCSRRAYRETSTLDLSDRPNRIYTGNGPFS